MSSAHDGHKPPSSSSSSSPFGGSPFRTFFHRGSTPSPKLHELLQSFEETLQERFKALRPGTDPAEVLTLSWATSAVESLSRTHVDVKALIEDLEFPLTDWDEQWMDAYLDDSVKLLDICIALSAELSHLDQGHLFLQYALHSLGSNGLAVVPSPERVQAARRSLRDWARQVGSRSPKLANSLAILQDLARSLHQSSSSSSSKPRKNSAKAKVLMQAMYGVKVQTIFVCGAVVAALSGSEATLLDLQVPDTFLWSREFHEVQAAVVGEIRRAAASCRADGRGVLLREFHAVHASTERLLAIMPTGDDGTEGYERLIKDCLPNLRESAQVLSTGMDKLSKQVNCFFQIVLTGRDALLCNLRMPGAMEQGYK